MAAEAIYYAPPNKPYGDQQRDRLLALAGGYSWEWFWDPLVTISGLTGSTGAGGVAAAFIAGGLVQLDSGTTSGFSRLFWGSPSLIVPGGSSSRFAAIFRVAVPTTVDANTQVRFGLRNVGATSFLFFGANGSVSTAKWSLLGDSAQSAVGTINISTGISTHMIVRVGTTLSHYVDGVLNFSGNYFPASDCGLFLDATDGGAAASRKLNAAYVGLLYPSR